MARNEDEYRYDTSSLCEQKHGTTFFLYGVTDALQKGVTIVCTNVILNNAYNSAHQYCHDSR